MKNVRVLVVDDEVFVQEVASLVLSDKGYVVQTANSGEQALEAYGLFMPDVVICDLLMPEMDGATFYARMRKRGHRTPFVFLTSVRDAGLAAAALRAGAAEYHYKPMMPDRLVETVDRLAAAAQERSAEDISPVDTQIPPYL